MKRHQARGVVLFEQKPRQRRGQHFGAFQLRAPGGCAPIVHRGAGIANNVEADIGLLHVTLDTQPVAARVEPPIQVTQIVAGLVIAVVAELDAKPVKRAVMQPAEEAFHDVARFEIQSLQRRQQFRVEALGQGLDRGGHGLRPKAETLKL